MTDRMDDNFSLDECFVLRMPSDILMISWTHYGCWIGKQTATITVEFCILVAYFGSSSGTEVAILALRSSNT